MDNMFENGARRKSFYKIEKLVQLIGYMINFVGFHTAVLTLAIEQWNARQTLLLIVMVLNDIMMQES